MRSSLSLKLYLILVLVLVGISHTRYAVVAIGWSKKTKYEVCRVRSDKKFWEPTTCNICCQKKGSTEIDREESQRIENCVCIDSPKFKAYGDFFDNKNAAKIYEQKYGYDQPGYLAPYSPLQYSGHPGDYSGHPVDYSGHPVDYSGHPGDYSGHPGDYSGHPGDYSSHPGYSSRRPVDHRIRQASHRIQPVDYSSHPDHYETYPPVAYRNDYDDGVHYNPAVQPNSYGHGVPPPPQQVQPMGGSSSSAASAGAGGASAAAAAAGGASTASVAATSQRPRKQRVQQVPHVMPHMANPAMNYPGTFGHEFSYPDPRLTGYPNAQMPYVPQYAQKVHQRRGDFSDSDSDFEFEDRTPMRPMKPRKPYYKR